MKKIDKLVGRRVRMRRTLLGITQQNLAKSIGVTFQQIQKYELGSNSLSATRLYQLSKSMRVPIEYFFADIGDAAISIEEKDDDLTSNVELFEIMRAFKQIKNPVIRRKIANLTRIVT